MKRKMASKELNEKMLGASEGIEPVQKKPKTTREAAQKKEFKKMGSKELNEAMKHAARKKGTGIQSFLSEGSNVNFLDKVS